MFITENQLYIFSKKLAHITSSNFTQRLKKYHLNTKDVDLCVYVSVQSFLKRPMCADWHSWHT